MDTHSYNTTGHNDVPKTQVTPSSLFYGRHNKRAREMTYIHESANQDLVLIMTEKSFYKPFAVGVGVLCSILLIALVYAIVTYPSMLQDKDSQIAEKVSQINDLQTYLNGNLSEIDNLDGQIKNLNANVSSLSSQLTDLQNQISSKNSQIDSLTLQRNQLQAWLNDNVTALSNAMAQISNLTDIVTLKKSTVWVDNQTIDLPVGGSLDYTFSADYVGYLTVYFRDFSYSSHSVVVWYSFNGIKYGQGATVDRSGTAYFPILPSADIPINITSSVEGVSGTVTITYYY